MTHPVQCIFSIDVEDWFHILDVPAAPDLPMWNALPSRVEANFMRLLDLLSEGSTTHPHESTCFFLGWVAERFPHLVREAVARGHEIASHGYSHRLIYTMTSREFREDARRSRLMLEDIAGRPVVGYRAPGFSSTSATPWFFPELCASGYRYDSSVFPARRGHGGCPAGPLTAHYVLNESLIELPVTVADVALTRICFSGGGYLRLFPYRAIRNVSKKLLNKGRHVMFYIHPREIDPSHPRIPMAPHRRFKSYVNLDTTEGKIQRILREFPVASCKRYLSERGWLRPAHSPATSHGHALVPQARFVA